MANLQNNDVSVINTTTNSVTPTVNVGNAPAAFGKFIGKPAPIITWSNPADIVYGTPLSNIQLNASSSVPGTFVYTPPAGTELSVATYILNTTFTPTDTANYTTASATVSINVSKATPTITWSNLSSITYGTKLSNAQLDASASNQLSGNPVPGFFFYTQPVGTLLNADSQMLNVLFIPTDPIDYNITSETALMSVTKATPTITWNNPADITQGTPLSSTQLNAVASVPGTFAYIPPSGTVLNVGTNKLTVSFTPTDTTNYNTASATVSINVLKKKNPVIWST